MVGIVRRRDYCEFLIGTQVNYTCTYFADHTNKFSHDAVRAYLKRDQIGSEDIWKQAEGDIIMSANGYLVADKNDSKKIALVRRQWSGNSKRVIRGIGRVNCVYVNPELNLFWIIDFRLYDIDGDGKTKLDHVQDMLDNGVVHKKLPFRTVLMDTWYAKVSISPQTGSPAHSMVACQ